ncbi:MAG: hypothetical protein U1E38_05465 [Rhodospirillales bacterium]
MTATFSGGGTRAAALSEGVLKELATVQILDGRRLSDEIDLISATSDGNVTAANFVLNSHNSFATYEDNFLKRNLMTPLITGV